MHKIIKVFYVVLRNLIKVVDGFSPRRYMKLYNWYLKKIGVDLYGYPRFIHPTVYFDGKGYKNTHIGENVVLSKNVLILNHDYSITCGLRSIGKKVVDNEAYWLRDIYIGNNVFVGANVSILPGTTIGDNCIVGTGAVIKGIIPENSKVIGNPAKIVGKTTEWATKKEEKADYLFE